MDDGSRHEDGLYLSVYVFSNEDVNKLMFTIQNKFNIKCSIHYNRIRNLVFIFLNNLWII
jgi:LAGLIDADG DNA endonuclease family